MQILVIFFLVSYAYASDEVFDEEPSDNDEITTGVYYGMIGDISSKGRRYEVDDTTDIIEEVSKTEENNSLGDETEKPPPIPFSRNVRSFDFYDDLYDSYRRKHMKENKNNDPKNVLNDIRSRNSPSNYNEDQQRRMFFSHIFSLFDDDKNTRRSGKSDVKNKHSKSHIDREIDTFKSPKTERPIQSKHDSQRKTSLKNMEPEYDSFESTIESYLNGKLPNNQYNEENERKHKRKNKGRHHNSRPERQLGDPESYEIVENENQEYNALDHEVKGNPIIKNRKRKNAYNDAIFDSQRSFKNKFETSTRVSETDNEKESSETSYLVRTPSFNYYQTDVTHASTDERSVEVDELITNITSTDDNHDKDTDVIEVTVDKFNKTDSEDFQDSVTSNLDIESNTNEHIGSTSKVESIQNDREIIENEPLKVIVEELTNNQNLSGSDIVNTRRMNYINVDKEMDTVINKPNISTIKEEIETPERELQVSKDYGEAVHVRNPLSARIKLDLLIQLPSQIEVGNKV